MQSLNVAKLTEQLKQLTHKVYNYTVLSYNSLREHIRQNYENYVVYLALSKITLICVQICIHCHVITVYYLKYVHGAIYTCVTHPSGLCT